MNDDEGYKGVTLAVRLEIWIVSGEEHGEMG